jgi:acetoin utilization protein AcuB
MLVYERMTRHPITVPPDMPVAQALQMMRDNRVRRFPVIDPKSNKLVGIVTEKALLYASPSPVTSLSIHEIHYLMAKITVQEVMATELITVTEDTAIEEAALLMVDNRVGALPVMRDQQLVGIITETDLFKTFIELFSARERGIRLTVLVPEVKGQLAAVTQAISQIGGNILSLGTFLGEDMSNRLLTIKVAEVEQQALLDKMHEIGAKVVDVRMCEHGIVC